MKKFIVEIQMVVSKSIVLPANDLDDAVSKSELLLNSCRDRTLLAIDEVTVSETGEVFVKKSKGEEFAIIDATVDIAEVRSIDGTGLDG